MERTKRGRRSFWPLYEYKWDGLLDAKTLTRDRPAKTTSLNPQEIGLDVQFRSFAMDMEASTNMKKCMSRASWADSTAAPTESTSEVVSGRSDFLDEMVAAGAVDASAVAHRGAIGPAGDSCGRDGDGGGGSSVST